MGGEGSMSNAIVSLKQNRALLKRRKLRDIRDLIYVKSGKTELEFKKISAQELSVIKAAIRKEAKKAVRLEIAIYAISILLAFLIGYLIYYCISN